MIYFKISLIALGLILRGAAFFYLRENFSLNLKVPQHLCEKGIYKYIRHPAYLGGIMILSGLFLINNFLGFISLVYFFFYNRINLEEQIIKIKFPEYREYQRRVNMFIPKIFKKGNKNGSNSSTSRQSSF